MMGWWGNFAAFSLFIGQVLPIFSKSSDISRTILAINLRCGKRLFGSSFDLAEIKKRKPSTKHSICSRMPAKAPHIGWDRGLIGLPTIIWMAFIHLRRPFRHSIIILDSNNVGFMNELPVHIPPLPWLSVLQAVGLGGRNIERKLGLATHIISL